MKKLRIPFIVIIAMFIALLVVGSFNDLQISQTLFSERNTFGIIMSTIGTTPGYSLIAFIGGGCIALALTRNYLKWQKIILFISAVIALGLSIFFIGREFFGANGFTNALPEWSGYFIIFPFMVGVEYLGYRVCRKSTNPRLWLVFILIIAMFLLVPLVFTILKEIFHRPRYRSVVAIADERLSFHNWWQRCANYKELMAEFSLGKEEFKSYPSGHACASTNTLFFALLLPYIDKKFEKYSLVVFCVGIAWALLISFTRILVGAHFLSDVSTGALLASISLFVTNEWLINVKAFRFEEEQVQAA